MWLTCFKLPIKSLWYKLVQTGPNQKICRPLLDPVYKFLFGPDCRPLQKIFGPVWNSGFVIWTGLDWFELIKEVTHYRSTVVVSPTRPRYYFCQSSTSFCPIQNKPLIKLPNYFKIWESNKNFAKSGHTETSYFSTIPLKKRFNYSETAFLVLHISLILYNRWTNLFAHIFCS